MNTNTQSNGHAGKAGLQESIKDSKDNNQAESGKPDIQPSDSILDTDSQENNNSHTATQGKKVKENAPESTVDEHDIDIQNKIKVLYDLIKEANITDEQAQIELAYFLDLIRDVEYTGEPDHLASIEIAIKSLIKNPSNLKFAQKIRRHLTHRVGNNSYYKKILKRGTPAAKVALGIFLFLFIVIPIGALLTLSFHYLSYAAFNYTLLTAAEMKLIYIVGGGGALGSIVSIMIRMNDLKAPKKMSILERRNYSNICLFTGLFKPLIGVCFAMLVFNLYKSHILPFEFKGENDIAFYFVISFISGFSERFASDLISYTEKNIVIVK